jgi:hypothetical protein
MQSWHKLGYNIACVQLQRKVNGAILYFDVLFTGGSRAHPGQSLPGLKHWEMIGCYDIRTYFHLHLSV